MQVKKSRRTRKRRDRREEFEGKKKKKELKESEVRSWKRNFVGGWTFFGSTKISDFLPLGNKIK